MNRRQSLEKGILSPPGPFLTPSPSPSVQHSPRLQPSPSQSPFQQDVLLVTNNNQHFINTFTTTQEQDRKTGTPNRRLSVNHTSPNAGTIIYRPSSQSPASIVSTNVGNEFNTTLVGSNNISLNKKGKRIPQNASQYVSTSNSCSPKASKKTMGLMGSPVASPSPSPTLNTQQIIQQFPMMNANNSIVFMQQPASSQRPTIIQTSNAHQSNVYASASNTMMGSAKQNKAPQQILPKPAAITVSASSSSISSSQANPSIITNANNTKQIVTQSKMAIVQQSNQQHQQHFQSPPHQSQHLVSSNSSGSGSSPSPQPHQVSQGGPILLPSGAQPLLLNQMPVLVQQNTPQGVQLILRPPSAPQLAAPSLVIHNRPTQMQQHQPQQLLRILNTNGAMQLATATATPTFIVSSQANIIQQNLQSIKTPSSGTSQINQLSGIQQSQQPNQQRHSQQILNSHILGQSVAQIQNLQLNGNQLTQIQMPNGQYIQQLPAQFQQNIGGFNQIQPMTAIAANATFQSPPNNSQNDIVSTVSSQSNPIQFTTSQQMSQGPQIISPVATPQPQLIQSDQSIMSSPPSISFNSQPQTAVILTGDKQMHRLSSPPPQTQNYSIIHRSGATEMITMDMSQHRNSQPTIQTKPAVTKPPRKPKKSKKQKALELAQEQQQQAQIQAQQQQQQQQQQQNEQASLMSPRNSQAPTGKLDLANVMKLCGIMEDDDFMDTDEPQNEATEYHSEPNQQSQTIHIPSNINGGENSATDIMITFPGGSTDQPFTFTIPSSSLENSDESNAKQGNSSDGKVSHNVPFMIRFDPGDAQNGGQPYTISIPSINDHCAVDDNNKHVETSSSSSNAMCVPSFVNSVLNSSVTPTIQSQINEIQNQLMALPPAATGKAAKAPRQKKQSAKKTKKQLEKTIEVPTQIGNIQISQIDGSNAKNTLGNKNMNNINNQIQIMPIMEKCQTSGNNSGQIIEKQKMSVPVMQQTISHQNSHQQHNNNNNNQQQHQQQNSHSNSGPSQVNINVQQNQLINVTNNLQMQVISNPQHQQHNSGATPAHGPPTSSNQQTQSQNSVVTSQALNTQNLIGNIITAQQGQPTGNIIIQSNAFNHQQQQQSMPANIQVNIQNQTIANNIITTAPVNQNQVQSNVQQPTAQSILSQLTGNLVLSLSEDGRLILRHDPNIPQDAQSQMILQTILTGALGNVSLINEPLKASVQIQNHQQSQQQHIIGVNGKIQHMTTMQNKNVIISSQPQNQMQNQPQQIFNNLIQSHSMPGNLIQNHQQQQPVQVQTTKMESSNNQQQQVVMPNPNILKFVELPKIQPNQQLFSLNTITNEITQLNPNQTTAALSPMERLLIVPSGINAQQLAQCLSQGQIHFNNIGQAPSTDPNKVQQIQQQQQIQVQQQQMKTVHKVSTHYVKKEPAEPKPKKVRGKKAKLFEEQQLLLQQQKIKIEIKKEPTIQSPPPMKMISLADTNILKATTVTTSTITTTMNSIAKNTITISPSSSLNVNPPKVSTKVTQVNNQKANQKQNCISVIPTTTLVPKHSFKPGKNQQIKSAITPQLSPIMPQQAAPPPLVSVNQAPIPRVQTIQLTPQKQQSLKNVQMSIQQLSAKLQNKNLLATLTADVEPNNPVHNNPLPVLNNINMMTDSEIYNSLQRLFVEQQKILATGKIIPTIPAAAAAAVSPQMTNTSLQQTTRTIQATQPVFSSIITSNASTIFSSVSSHSIASPIQVNAPTVKQEPACSTSMSSSQPPPLVVSTPIQMQIKTEVQISPTSISSSIASVSPPATGSIIISPKYTTAANKTVIDPHKEIKLLSEIKKDTSSPVAFVQQQPDIVIEQQNLLKQQQLAAASEANRKMKITRSSLFARQMNVDQEGSTRPDYKTDFCSKEDAIKRLIRYHCLYDEVKNEHDPKEEYEFDKQAKMFLDSYEVMQKKYQSLLIKQSQQFAPTSELMMLDRLRVADLKDEIVSMQSELNSVLFEQHQKSQAVIKNENVPIPVVNHMPQQQPAQLQTPSMTPTLVLQPYPRSNQGVKIMQEPSQILKAKQEQKLYQNIKNERIKIEISEEAPKETKNLPMNFVISPVLTSPSASHSKCSPQQTQVKIDLLKNEPLSTNTQSSHVQSQLLSPVPGKLQSQTNLLEMKPELDDFDIESEIRPNLIMKKCESSPSTPPPSANTIRKSQKQKEREFSPLSEYLNPKINNQAQNKPDTFKNETHDGSFDEWIQKELSMQLTPSSSKKKDVATKSHKSKLLDNDLAEIFEHTASPKSVEKQLDDLFSSTSKSNDLLAAASPLTEFFSVEQTTMSEKTVENRLEDLFGGAEEDSRKSNHQDLVETRLEQLFQGSVADNDESALDNASFLYKNQEMTYEGMIQKQVLATPANEASSSTNKRQWVATCDMFASSQLFTNNSSPPQSKRACTGEPSIPFDNKWIEDNFDFASEILSTESTSDDLPKHRSWNGNIDHRETMIGGMQSPHHNQFHLSATGEASSAQHHANPGQSHQENDQHMNMIDRHEMMDTQMGNMNYEDVDDISRQVQNAIDSILNLQSSDPLHYQLDSSFLELNAITAPSGAPNSPINIQHTHPHQSQMPHLGHQFQNPRQDFHGFNDHKPANTPKRKYSRLDDIGDCLIGGSNLDDSPSALAIGEGHSIESTPAGEFVNNLLNCEEKSITSS